MKTWDEFIKWLDNCPKIESRLIECSSGLIEAKPFNVIMCETEEIAKEEMMKEILADIWNPDIFNVWVRVMPEITSGLELSKDGLKEKYYQGYARIAYERKPELVTNYKITSGTINGACIRGECECHTS